MSSVDLRNFEDVGFGSCEADKGTLSKAVLSQICDEDFRNGADPEEKVNNSECTGWRKRNVPLRGSGKFPDFWCLRVFNGLNQFVTMSRETRLNHGGGAFLLRHPVQLLKDQLITPLQR